MSSPEPSVLQQLMVAATDDPDARNEALALLRTAPLYVCPWPADPSQIRTLTNSDGLTALPAFTSLEELNQAARQFGWHMNDGTLPSTKLTISDVVNYARRAGITLVALDLAADHVLELDDGDMELLAAVSLTSAKPPSGRGLARVPTQPPIPPGSERPGAGSGHPRAHSTGTHLRPASIAPAADGTVSATFGGSSQVSVQALTDHVPEALTDGLANVLRDFPEVEWACLVRANRGGPGESTPAVGLRVEPAFRKNLNEIIVRVREAGIMQGATLDVLLLDDPGTMRQARQVGVPFYPWKK